MFREEKIARSLFNDIREYFENTRLNLISKLEGAGVHWHCMLELEQYKVSIYSCDIHYQPDEKGRTEEFIIYYFQEGEKVSSGRTSNREKVLKSAEIWLKNKSKEQLYREFDFVDRALRQVQRMESKWLQKFPELVNTSRILENEGSGIVRYEISHDDRSCFCNTVGEQSGLYLCFSWDGCIVFETQTVEEETAEVLKRYLLDKEAPSSLNKEFSWIPTNILTENYEKGKGVEGEFIESWEYVSQSYEDFPENSLLSKHKIIVLIQELKKLGFDKTIRAGRSMTNLVLSRARRPGMWDNRPHLTFAFGKDDTSVITEKEEVYELNNIELNQEIIDLVRELERAEIN